MTLLFAIRTPLSPPENHIDQYRYASIRSRDTLSPPRQLLPVFHVKHVRTRTCLLLVSSLLRLSSGRNTGWLFVIGGQANEGVWRSIGVHGAGINLHFHAANLKRPVVSRETEVVFQRCSLFTLTTEP